MAAETHNEHCNTNSSVWKNNTFKLSPIFMIICLVQETFICVCLSRNLIYKANLQSKNIICNNNNNNNNNSNINKSVKIILCWSNTGFEELHIRITEMTGSAFTDYYFRCRLHSLKHFYFIHFYSLQLHFPLSIL